MRLLRGCAGGDAAHGRQRAGAAADRLPGRDARELQGIARGAALGPGGTPGADDPGGRRPDDRPPRRLGDRPRRPDLLPGADRERGVPADGDRARVDPRARPRDRLRARPRSRGRHRPRLHPRVRAGLAGLGSPRHGHQGAEHSGAGRAAADLRDGRGDRGPAGLERAAGTTDAARAAGHRRDRDLPPGGRDEPATGRPRALRRQRAALGLRQRALGRTPADGRRARPGPRRDARRLGGGTRLPALRPRHRALPGQREGLHPPTAGGSLRP